MGILGLLPLLKPIQQPKHISAFAGQRMAVDAYVFLHRAAYGCAMDLCLGLPTIKYNFTSGQFKRRFVSYCMERAMMFKHFNIDAVWVFDGASLPAKKLTDQKRAEY